MTKFKQGRGGNVNSCPTPPYIRWSLINIKEPQKLAKECKEKSLSLKLVPSLLLSSLSLPLFGEAALVALRRDGIFVIRPPLGLRLRPPR